MSDNNNIKNILEALAEANKKITFPVWIPSLNKEVRFTGFSVGQQKQLIRALVDSPVYKTNFTLAIYEILKSNIIDKSIDIDKLTIIDKAVMLVWLRAHAVGASYDTTIDEIDYRIYLDCNKMAKRYTTLSLPVLGEQLSPKPVVTFTAAVPTICCEYKFEKECRIGPVEDIQNYDDLRKILGDAYIGELAKYINTVTVGDLTIDIRLVSFKEAQEIIEKLEMSQLKQVIDFIEATQNFINNLLTFGVLFESDNEGPTAMLSIDAAFFVTQ